MSAPAPLAKPKLLMRAAPDAELLESPKCAVPVFRQIARAMSQQAAAANIR